MIALKADPPDINGQARNYDSNNKNNIMKTKRQTPDKNINTILRDLNSPSSSSSSPHSQSKPKPTIAKSKFSSTKNLKELVIGRCYEYMFKSNQSSTTRWDCGLIWSKLFEAFSYKGPCEVNQRDYEGLIDLMDEDIPKDKVCISNNTKESDLFTICRHCLLYTSPSPRDRG